MHLYSKKVCLHCNKFKLQHKKQFFKFNFNLKNYNLIILFLKEKQNIKAKCTLEGPVAKTEL